VKRSQQEIKDSLISDWLSIRKSLIEAAFSVPAANQNNIFLGIWSIKDLLAHLIGWDYTNLEAIKRVIASELPAFYHEYDKDWRNYNARLVLEFKSENYADLLEAVKISHNKVIGYLTTLPASHIEEDYGVRFKGYKVTVARLLQAEIDDEKTHLKQVQDFIGKINIPGVKDIKS
jgi:hypothetical protein